MDNSSYLNGDWLGKTLQPVYRRCGSLVIDDLGPPSVHTPSIASITDMPCLEYLKLIPADSLMEGWSPALPIYQAPRLRRLEITAVNLSMGGPLHKCNSSIFQQFPWAQITTFKLSMLHVLELWKFLGRCIHLSELTVRKVHCFDLAYRQDYLDFMNTPELFTLPHLISIDIEFYESNDLDCALSVLFSKLTAPVLKHLTISAPWYMSGHSRQTWPLNVFNNFVVRSADSRSGLFMLSSLHINGFPITVLGLLAVLKRLPCLSELEITEPEEQLISDELLYGLCLGMNTGPSGEQPCVPRLLNFCLNLPYRRIPAFKTETLNEMVRSRWIPDPTCASAMGVACLRSIKVVRDKRMGEEALGYELLRELEKSGLQVEIS
ncbi:hypothetical protein K435DRAFT_876951 [Dendrothele bispora CBS 962.96]|uniref:F-box domain-containing protein n=1 Tax=Dendrothele bispora (strain CBS 962.96) TaxID=1314807 RepID=A0A4S8KR62_DENBC|nr:hypothetical protein K435DRAFT_876951 [Dendrothele bispora CBS 962.96]